MSAQATTTDGTAWALALTGLTQVYLKTLKLGKRCNARALTVVHTSWLRRDLVWAVLPALLAAAVHPH